MPYPAPKPIRMTRTKSDSRLPRSPGFAIGALHIAHGPAGHARSDARVAQLVEHMTENHGVGGSIPSPGTTTFSNHLIYGLFS